MLHVASKICCILEHVFVEKEAKKWVSLNHMFIWCRHKLILLSLHVNFRKCYLKYLAEQYRHISCKVCLYHSLNCFMEHYCLGSILVHYCCLWNFIQWEWQCKTTMHKTDVLTKMIKKGKPWVIVCTAEVSGLVKNLGWI